MNLHWFLTVILALVALVAFIRLRRISKRLERLSESYWELRYDHGQLGARVARLEGGAPPAAAPKAPETTANFVPLSSLKR